MKRSLPALLAAIAALLPALFFGCLGGTSAEGGNPEVIVAFESADGSPMLASGDLRFYVQDAPAELVQLPFDDGFGNQSVIILGQGDSPANQILSRDAAVAVRAGSLKYLLNSRSLVGLAKRAAATYHLPAFNMVFIGADDTVGSIFGVTVDSAGGFHLPGEAGASDTLWMRLRTGRTFSGTIDTTGLGKPPLAVFIPGTPFFASVDGNAFSLAGVPDGAFPFRLVAHDGRIFALDSLGADTAALELKPGARVDSVALPETVPVMAPPEATPRGEHHFTDSVGVSFWSPDGGEIRYTLDGSLPTRSSKLYKTPLVFKTSVTVLTKAFRMGYKSSAVSMNNYTLVPEAPVASPRSQAFKGSLLVTLSAKGASPVIYYTTNGDQPDTGSAVYAPPGILLTETTQIRAVTKLSGLGLSHDVMIENYVLVPDTLAGH